MFLLRDSDATQHLFQVSAGLGSLVLGEGQILAQVKQVVKVGQGGRGLGKNIDRLFKDAITAGKRVPKKLCSKVFNPLTNSIVWTTLAFSSW